MGCHVALIIIEKLELINNRIGSQIDELVTVLERFFFLIDFIVDFNFCYNC